MTTLLPLKLAEKREAAARGELAAARRWDSVPVAIRTATAADATRLAELAALDDAPLPVGPVLVAEAEGAIEAALPLKQGRPFADPFRPTRALLEMLDLRAAQLGATTAGGRPL